MQNIPNIDKEETLLFLNNYIDENSQEYIYCFLSDKLKLHGKSKRFDDVTFFIEHWYGILKGVNGRQFNSYSTGIFGKATEQNKQKRQNFVKTIINHLNK